MKFNKIAAVIAMSMVSAVFAQEAAQPAAAEVAPVAEAVQPAAVEAAPVAEAAQPAAVEAAPVAEAAQPAAVEAAPVAKAAQPAAVEATPVAAPATEKPAAEKVAESFTLKGNIQAQATKSIADEDNNISKGWFRANIGGQYKSENLDGLVMLRIFTSTFGNNIDGKSYDNILADLYWANYKWAPSANDKINLKVGHWKTDWSQSTHFGTYIDAPLTNRGLWMRDYRHNAVELGWNHGFNQLNAMLAVKDNKANTGYLRVEDDMKFTFPLEVKVAYRGNIIDQIQNTAYMTHRVAAYMSYAFIPGFRLYGEYACLYTQDEDINENVDNYVKQELAYMNEAGKMYMPFYVGLELPVAMVPGLNILFSNLYYEMEYVKDRQEIQADADELAWTVAMSRTIGKSKLQFSVYSEKEMTDVGLAFRLTTTFK